MSGRSWLVGLMVTAAAVTAAGGADAQVFGSNLVVNGDAETGSTTGFSSTGDLSIFTYDGGNGFPGGNDPGVSAGGKFGFYGGGAAVTIATQIFNVSSGSSSVDSGSSTYDLSALLGGYAGQADYASVTISFLSSGNFSLGGASIGPVTSSDRSDTTGLLFRETSGIIPIGTRSISLMLRLTLFNGGVNDGYADNISLVLNDGGPVAVPGPIAGAGLVPLLGLAGAWFARRRRQNLAA